jgi:hypothetical protein
LSAGRTEGQSRVDNGGGAAHSTHARLAPVLSRTARSASPTCRGCRGCGSERCCCSIAPLEHGAAQAGRTVQPAAGARWAAGRTRAWRSSTRRTPPLRGCIESVNPCRDETGGRAGSGDPPSWLLIALLPLDRGCPAPPAR